MALPTTRDPARIPKILSEIEKYWKQFPDMRLGQIVVVASQNRDPFYVEDTEMLKQLQLLNKRTGWKK